MLLRKACAGLSVAVCVTTLIMSITTMAEDNTAIGTTTVKTNIFTRAMRVTRGTKWSRGTKGSRGTRGSKGTKGSRRTRVTRISKWTRGTRVSKGPHLSCSTKSVYYRMLYKIEKALKNTLICWRKKRSIDKKKLPKIREELLPEELRYQRLKRSCYDML